MIVIWTKSGVPLRTSILELRREAQQPRARDLQQREDQTEYDPEDLRQKRQLYRQQRRVQDPIPLGDDDPDVEVAIQNVLRVEVLRVEGNRRPLDLHTVLLLGSALSLFAYGISCGFSSNHFM